MVDDSGSRHHESPRERIARFIREGMIPHEQVAAAEQFWREYLLDGVPLPNGEHARITEDDLFHLIEDGRIRRKPQRIVTLLHGIYAIHTANWGRRRGFSQWEEGGERRYGYVILEANSRVRTMHLIDAGELRRLLKQGDLLWKR